MMLDAVTFDLGSARPPLFTFPDVSELAPLTFPDEFLRGQSHQPQAELPTDTVRRFETVMSAEPPLPPSVVKSVMECMIPESRRVEGQEVESPKVKSPTVEIQSPAIETQAPTIEIQRPKVEGDGIQHHISSFRTTKSSSSPSARAS